jgi:hypothetical protein
MVAVVHQGMARVATTGISAIVDNLAGRPMRFDNRPIKIAMRESFRQ